MDVTKTTESLMLMKEETWGRHANPWSVYTRFSILPIISLAFWSREWIGLYCIIPVVLSFIWIWLNPRLFKAPTNTNNWASMGTFGERIYLNRRNTPIPEHHQLPATVLQVLASLGLPIFIYGLYNLNLWALILGNVWIMVFKAWFVDRMVWLFKDMKDDYPQYSKWLKP